MSVKIGKVSGKGVNITPKSTTEIGIHRDVATAASRGNTTNFYKF